MEWAGDRCGARPAIQWDAGIFDRENRKFFGDEFQESEAAGAGAIVGYFAVGSALAKHEVSVIARDARLDTIQRNGLRHISGDHEMRVTVIAKDDPADLDAQDVVSCALA